MLFASQRIRRERSIPEKDEFRDDMRPQRRWQNRDGEFDARSNAKSNTAAAVKRGDRVVQKSFGEDEKSNAIESSERLTPQQLVLLAAHRAVSLNKKRGQTVRTNSNKGKSDANIVSFAAANSAGNPALVNGKGANVKNLGYSVLAGLLLWICPAPAGVTTQAWHLFSVFVATIVRIITRNRYRQVRWL